MVGLSAKKLHYLNSSHYRAATDPANPVPSSLIHVRRGPNLHIPVGYPDSTDSKPTILEDAFKGNQVENADLTILELFYVKAAKNYRAFHAQRPDSYLLNEFLNAGLYMSQNSIFFLYVFKRLRNLISKCINTIVSTDWQEDLRPAARRQADLVSDRSRQLERRTGKFQQKMLKLQPQFTLKNTYFFSP